MSAVYERSVNEKKLLIQIKPLLPFFFALGPRGIAGQKSTRQIRSGVKSMPANYSDRSG